MTKLLTVFFVVLWTVMGFIELHNGDLFHTVTSLTIALWNIAFLRDSIVMERKVNSIDKPRVHSEV